MTIKKWLKLKCGDPIIFKYKKYYLIEDTKKSSMIVRLRTLIGIIKDITCVKQRENDHENSIIK